MQTHKTCANGELVDSHFLPVLPASSSESVWVQDRRQQVLTGDEVALKSSEATELECDGVNGGTLMYCWKGWASGKYEACE